MDAADPTISQLSKDKTLRFAGRLVLSALLAVAAILAPVPVTAAPAAPFGQPPSAATGVDYVPGCPTHPAPGTYTCYSLHRIGLRQPAAAAATPQGYGPAALQSAYALPSSTSGANQTVYIIDAYGYPNAESDLATYRATYGLPVCTTANGCFRKLNQNGLSSPLPAYDAGWAGETALDLDMVSAVCPKCKITLIEANDSGDNLFTAVARATTLGAKYVSMSWGGQETGNEAYYDTTYFNHTGVVYAVSSGDWGYANGVSYPSTSTHTVAVGGTSLVTAATSRGWSETAWGTNWGVGTGSGCSAFVAKPSWQHIIAGSVCAKRAGNDVSAVADPNTGVAVYQRGSMYGDWSVSGGTSAGAPIIAAVFALAGPPFAADHPASYLYAAPAALHDVTTGNNGSCSPNLLCTAATGWDGPTGLGTPSGVTAFRSPQSVSINNPGNQVSSINNPVSLAVTAGRARFPVTFRAFGLPTGLRMSASGVVSGTPTQVSTSAVTVSVTDATPATSSATFTWTVGNAGAFTPVKAFRMLDTRDGTGARRGPVPANGSVAVQVLGRGGVPASGVSAVVVNVTVTNPAGPGYVSVYPDGAAKSVASSLNYVKGQTVPNLVLAPVGTDGKIRLYTYAGADLIADVAGYYLRGVPRVPGTLRPLNPARLLDTRIGTGARAVAVPSNGRLTLQVLGRAGVPQSGVSAVALNVTVTGSRSAGHLTVYPDPVRLPNASNLNFPAGGTVANLVMAPVLNGKVQIFVSGGGGTNVIADVSGFFISGAAAAAGTFTALTPARLLDSRSNTGGLSRPLGNNGTFALKVTGSGGVPGTRVTAVVLNVVAVSATGSGHLTTYSAGVAQPATSNLNFVRGQTVANLVIVPVSTTGLVKLTMNGAGTVGLVADVAGYYHS